MKKWKQFAGVEKSQKWKENQDIIILHKRTKTHDHRLYCSWNMAHDGCNCCFSIWAIFCPFTTPTAQKMKISNKHNNTWRYHPFTQLYQNSWLYAILFLRYGAWQLYRYNCYFSFWVIFCPLTPLPTQKMKISKKWKKHQDIMILHKCTKAHDDTLCCSWDMVRDGCNCCFFFPTLGNVLPFCHLNSPKNENFKKLKNTWRFYHFTQLHQKLRLQAILFLKYGTTQM